MKICKIIFAIAAVTTFCIDTWSAPAHLVYHCTLDNLDAITSPEVGEGGTKSAGCFVTGHQGNALQVPPYTQAVTVPFPNGLPIGKGRIEFYGRIDSGRSEFYDLGDPTFFGFHTKSGEVSLTLQYTANDGAGNSGLVLNIPGCPQASSRAGFAASLPYSCVMGTMADTAAWHHYAIIWNTNGIASISGRPAIALLFDDNIVLSRPVSSINFDEHVSWMSNTRDLTFSMCTTRNRPYYSIDEFKIWDTDSSDGVESPIIKPTSGTTFDNSLTISISCPSFGATIRYTTDGSEPTSTSTEYTGKFRIYGKTTIKAAAFNADGTVSATTVATYSKGYCASPEITAPSEFIGSKTKILMSCATDGSTIHYTTNGVDPNSHSPKYNGPIYVSDSATIKAYSTKHDFINSSITTHQIAKIWGIGDTLGKPDHMFETSGSRGFVRVEDPSATLGESMQSGAIGDEQKSYLTTTVVGPGTLTFKWRTSCESDEELHQWDHAELRIDGKKKCVLDGITQWVEVSQRITGNGEHTVVWAYVKDDTEKAGEDCLWVSDYSWKSDYTSTQTTEVPVPYNWLLTSSRDAVDEYDILERVAKQTAANTRLTVEQCYVAGLNPESATNEFVSTLEMQDGRPVVKWIPDLKSSRKYTIWGKSALVGTEEWATPTNALHRFFKVSVEMP